MARDYAAKEAFTTGIQPASDLWSVGKLCFMLLTGYSPSLAKSTEEFAEETMLGVHSNYGTLI